MYEHLSISVIFYLPDSSSVDLGGAAVSRSEILLSDTLKHISELGNGRCFQHLLHRTTVTAF